MLRFGADTERTALRGGGEAAPEASSVACGQERLPWALNSSRVSSIGKRGGKRGRRMKCQVGKADASAHKDEAQAFRTESSKNGH